MTSNDVSGEIELAITYLERAKLKLLELHSLADRSGMVTSDEKLSLYKIIENAENCVSTAYKKVDSLRRFFFYWKSQ